VGTPAATGGGAGGGLWWGECCGGCARARRPRSWLRSGRSDDRRIARAQSDGAPEPHAPAGSGSPHAQLTPQCRSGARPLTYAVGACTTACGCTRRASSFHDRHAHQTRRDTAHREVSLLHHTRRHAHAQTSLLQQMSAPLGLGRRGLAVHSPALPCFGELTSRQRTSCPRQALRSRARAAPATPTR
jgi:hypothetical protein